MEIFEKTNFLYGILITILTAIFGQYWFLFAGFLVLNCIDYCTGLLKAKFYKKNSSSLEGARGIAKKVFYWIVIGLAFFIAKSFEAMGHTIGVNLSFVELFGWFTLATYIINEIRSILENLVEMDVAVPAFLIKGLDVAEKMILDETEDDRLPGNSTTGDVEKKEGEK